MVKITIIDAAGAPRTLEVAAGTSVMQAALANSVAGIVAECGGNLSCATCHVYVDPALAGSLPPPDGYEAEMLDFTAAGRRPESRLCCQLVVTEELDGLVVTVPETQV